MTECAKENVTHVSVALASASFLQVRCFVFEQLMAAADLLLWICLKKYIYKLTIELYYMSILYKYTILVVPGIMTIFYREYGDRLPNMRVLLIKFPYLHRKAITNRSTIWMFVAAFTT